MKPFCSSIIVFCKTGYRECLVLLTIVLLMLAQPVKGAERADKEHIEAGRGIAMSICGECHAVLPEGLSPFEPAPPFRDVVKKWPVESLAEALAEGIVVGHEAMPEFQFGPEALTDLLAYLNWLKVETGEPESGY